MRLLLLPLVLWLAPIPQEAGTQAPPAPPPITGERPSPGVPEGAGVGEHEHAGHAVPPTGAVGRPARAEGQAPAQETPEPPPRACPCQPEDAPGPCPCPGQEGTGACPCRPEGVTGPCPCPHHAGPQECPCHQDGGTGDCLCEPHRERRRGGPRG